MPYYSAAGEYNYSFQQRCSTQIVTMGWVKTISIRKQGERHRSVNTNENWAGEMIHSRVKMINPPKVDGVTWRMMILW